MPARQVGTTVVGDRPRSSRRCQAPPTRAVWLRAVLRSHQPRCRDTAGPPSGGGVMTTVECRWGRSPSQIASPALVPTGDRRGEMGRRPASPPSTVQPRAGARGARPAAPACTRLPASRRHSPWSSPAPSRGKPPNVEVGVGADTEVGAVDVVVGGAAQAVVDDRPVAQQRVRGEVVGGREVGETSHGMDAVGGRAAGAHGPSPGGRWCRRPCSATTCPPGDARRAGPGRGAGPDHAQRAAQAGQPDRHAPVGAAVTGTTLAWGQSATTDATRSGVASVQRSSTTATAVATPSGASARARRTLVRHRPIRSPSSRAGTTTPTAVTGGSRR